MEHNETDIGSAPDESGAPVSVNDSTSKVFAVLGCSLALLPLPILFYVVLNLLLDYQAIVTTAEGDPRMLAGILSQRLVPLVLSLLIGLLGFLVAICAAGFGRYKSRWFFWALLVSALIYLFAFPVGTLMSLAAAFIAFRNKPAFFMSRSGP
ncbi:MAG: hypothetical protein AAGI27_15450 [Pseudomonadota bacterium]